MRASPTGCQGCALLDTCGQYFNKGAARARLDRFLTFFQVRPGPGSRHVSASSCLGRERLHGRVPPAYPPPHLPHRSLTPQAYVLSKSALPLDVEFDLQVRAEPVGPDSKPTST
jgi:hypothetical protein